MLASTVRGFCGPTATLSRHSTPLDVHRLQNEDCCSHLGWGQRWDERRRSWSGQDRYSQVPTLDSFLRAIADRSSLRTSRGCETYIVREGYEGLVRGNNTQHIESREASQAHSVSNSDPSLIRNLRFGDGALLKDGTGDHPGGRTLKGRHIVRVGWDDVRGWFAEVMLSPTLKEMGLNYVTGRDSYWIRPLSYFSHSRRSSGGRPQSYQGGHRRDCRLWW